MSGKPLNHLILIGFFGVLGGCSGSGGAIDAARGDGLESVGTVEIGTGTVDFESMVDDDELTLWAGPQGGHHFIVHARIKDLLPGDWEQPSLPENPSTTFSAFDEAGGQVDLELPPYALGYRDRGDEWNYLPSGRFLRLSDDAVPRLWGARVRIRVDVQDANGVAAWDERWIVAVPDSTVDAGVPDAQPADAGPP
jgi:hypothetical protein